MNSAQAWRRWLGMAFLAVAFGMLIWGQTVLKARLDGLGYIVYWLACFLFTILALMTALVDIWCVRRKQRLERRALIKNTFTHLADLDDDKTANQGRIPDKD
jgi:hypothetical protein